LSKWQSRLVPPSTSQQFIWQQTFSFAFSLSFYIQPTFSTKQKKRIGTFKHAYRNYTLQFDVKREIMAAFPSLASVCLPRAVPQVAAHDWISADCKSSKCKVCHKKIKTLAGSRCVWCREMVRTSLGNVVHGGSGSFLHTCNICVSLAAP